MSITEQDYIKVIEYIPVRKKNQLIVPYDLKKMSYYFSENDIRALVNLTNDAAYIDKTVQRILSDTSLNPMLSNAPKVYQWFLRFLFGLVFAILLAIFGIIFLFFLGDPVICFAYIYGVMYQLWWRGGRVGIEIFVERRRGVALQSFCNRLQKRDKMKWSVGGNGKWIQVDMFKMNSMA